MASSTTDEEQEKRLDLGSVYVSPEAAEAIVASGHTVQEFLDRHASGDWGDVGESAKEMNKMAMRYDWRVQSTYDLGEGFAIRVYTGMSRNTTVLLIKDGE